MVSNPPRNGRRGSGAFTLIELLVVIATIAILAALLFPVFAQAREKARSAACLSNLKQIGLATQQYSQDYDEALPSWDECLGEGFSDQEPPNGVGTSATCQGSFAWLAAGGSWQAKLNPYIKSGDPEGVAGRNLTGVWKCPSLGAKGELETYANSNRNPPSYGFNLIVAYTNYAGLLTGVTQFYRYPTMVEMDMPASTVLFGETGSDGRPYPPYDFKYRVDNDKSREIPDRHSGGANYVFADGHAKWHAMNEMYPAGPGVTANIRRARWVVAKYFAYNKQERDWCTANGTAP